MPGRGILHRAGRSPAGLRDRVWLHRDSIVPPFPVRRLLDNWHWRACRSHSVQHTGIRPRGSIRSGSRQCRQTYQSIGSVCIISFLQRRKKAENILVDAPGLRRCLCDLDLAALQFLTGSPDAQPPAVPADFCVHRSSGKRRRCVHLPEYPSASATPAAGWARPWRRTGSAASCHCSCFFDIRSVRRSYPLAFKQTSSSMMGRHSPSAAEA